MPRTGEVQFYFGIDVLQASDAVFRSIQSSCPTVLEELRELPEDPWPPLCNCTPTDAVTLAERTCQKDGACHVLTPLTPIGLIGHEVRRHKSLAGEIEAAFVEAISNKAASSLSSYEVEMLRQVVHDWPPTPASSLSDHDFGVLFLLTQRLVELGRGRREARALGPIPTQSLIDTEMCERQALSRAGLIVPEERVLVAIVPPRVHEWAIRQSLNTPELESTAALLRGEWRLNPDDSLPLCQTVAQTINELTRGIFETHRTRNRRGQPFEPVAPMRRLSTHATWLVRVQLLGESPSRIARGAQRERQTVEHAVHKLADLLGLVLRPLRGRGRPRGRRECGRRRVIQK